MISYTSATCMELTGISLEQIQFVQSISSYTEPILCSKKCLLSSLQGQRAYKETQTKIKPKLLIVTKVSVFGNEMDMMLAYH